KTSFSVVVDEQFGIARPCGCRAQRSLRLAPCQVILQFGFESCPGRAMTAALLENPTNMRDQRNKLQQMLAEQLLAPVRAAATREHAPGGCQFELVAVQFRELQNMQRFGDRI